MATPVVPILIFTVVASELRDQGSSLLAALTSFFSLLLLDSSRVSGRDSCWQREEVLWSGLGGFSMGLQGHIPLLVTARPYLVKNRGSSGFPGAGLPQEDQ